jgi:signal transduction histidine kinase
MADANRAEYSLPNEILQEKKHIEQAGRMRMVHWFILVLALVITVSAWQYSKSLVEQRAGNLFLRYQQSVIDQITERMSKYENALWGGVSAINTNGGVLTRPEWKIYADSLRIDTRYPGINGIGVIHSVPPKSLQEYLRLQGEDFPGFRVHPAHGNRDFLPITYIEPVATNRPAVGLDMAHERNRYRAALKARDTATAQITGPIVLVQDDQRTPGFLFYAPFYRGGLPPEGTERINRFAGLVYAPFIMKRLMAGTLRKEARQVSVRITDGGSVMYDEHVASNPDFDPKAAFRNVSTINMYGRNWTFEIVSAKSFRASIASNEPRFILAGGILIDILLLVLFVSFSLSNRRAISFAGRMSRNYEQKTGELENMIGQLAESNEELERFAYVASHDLQEPLRMVRSFTTLLQDRYGKQLDDDARNYMKIATESAERMQSLVDDLLHYARVGTDVRKLEMVSLDDTFEYIVENLQDAIAETGAEISADPLPEIMGNPSRISRVLQNLVGNGLKYQPPGRPPRVRVSAFQEKEGWVISVSDNGIGIADEFREQIFQPFRRLHARSEYSGTGMGLAICRKIVEDAGGKIWAESEIGRGSRFFFLIPAHNEPDPMEQPIDESVRMMPIEFKLEPQNV